MGAAHVLRQATVVLSSHRPETTPLAARQMRAHGAVFLEEPPDPLFHRMLEGDVPVDDYVMTLDVEYPEFSRAMGLVLQEIHRQGTPIFQVEPFLERLIRIHERFARGESPEDLDRSGPEYPVYLAERQATAALLTFYRHTAAGSSRGPPGRPRLDLQQADPKAGNRIDREHLSPHRGRDPRDRHGEPPAALDLRPAVSGRQEPRDR